MQRLVFTRDLETGDPVIDAHHRALFATANDLLFARDVRQDPQLFLQGVSFLKKYAGFHFAAEEAAMARWGYAALDKHRAHHHDLTVRITGLWELAGEEGPSLDLRNRLHQLIEDWLRYHIRVLDKDFIQHVDRARRAEAAAGAVVAPEDEAAGGDLGEVTRQVDATDEGGLMARIRRWWR